MASNIQDDIDKLDEIVNAIGTQKTGSKTPRELRDEAQPHFAKLKQHLERSDYPAWVNTLTKLTETREHLDEAVGIDRKMVKDVAGHRGWAMSAFEYVKSGIPGTPEHEEDND